MPLKSECDTTGQNRIRLVLCVIVVGALLVTAGCAGPGASSEREYDGSGSESGEVSKSVPEDYVDPDAWAVRTNITVKGPLKSVSARKDRVQESSDSVIVEFVFRNESAANRINGWTIISPDGDRESGTLSIKNEKTFTDIEYRPGTWTIQFRDGETVLSEVTVTLTCTSECDPEPRT